MYGIQEEYVASFLLNARHHSLQAFLCLFLLIEFTVELFD